MMLNKISYKKKNRFLIIVGVFSLILIYNFSIKETVGVYNTYKSNLEYYSKVTNAPLLLTQLENELSQINSKIGGQNRNQSKHSEMLIELLTNFCDNNNIVLRELPPIKISENGGVVVETNQFTVVGDFVSIVKLIYQLEQKNKLGIISSVDYKLQKDFKSPKNILTTTIFLQNIKKETE